MTVENPQGTPTDPEIAWLAGILEGEGTVSLAAWVRNEKRLFDGDRLKPGQVKISVHMKVYNTDAGIIGKVVDILDRLGVAHHVRDRELPPMAKPGGGEYRATAPMLTVTVSRLDVAYRLAKALHPYCFGEKRQRLALVIQYLARRFAKSEAKGTCRTEYDVADLRIVSDFYTRFARRPDNNAKLLQGLLNEYEQSTV